MNSEFESRVSVRPSNRTLSKLHFFLFPMLRGIGKKRKKSTFGWNVGVLVPVKPVLSLPQLFQHLFIGR